MKVLVCFIYFVYFIKLDFSALDNDFNRSSYKNNVREQHWYEQPLPVVSR